jgi:plastocyanin
MHRRPLIALAAGAVLLLAACSSGAATSAPASAAPSAAPSVEASMEASAPAGGAACAPSSEAGAVAVAIEDFTFNPADIAATVGQTITFTNSDSAPHTATLDDDTCTTPNISQGGSNGLVFNAAGTYPFHCDVHPNMKGTITVS